MSLDNVGGSLPVQGIPGQEDVGKTESVTSTAFNRTISTQSDVEATEGLKSDKPRREFPSIRDRITTPVDSSRTHSVKKAALLLAGELAGKAVDKVVPDKVQDGVTTLKSKAGKAAKAALEVVSEKATALKSATIGKLLRMIRSESFSKVDAGVTNNEALKGKISDHNKDVDKLAELKTQLKAEDAGLKEFRTKYKDALDLIDNPDKFISDSTPRNITIPGDEARSIDSAVMATRKEMVEMIRQDIMESPEYQEYDLKMSQKASGGTELYRERQELKSQMKQRASEMVDAFKKEVGDDLDAARESINGKRKDFARQHTEAISERSQHYEQRTEEARAKFEAKEKQVEDLKEERLGTREVLSETKKDNSRLEKDAANIVNVGRGLKTGKAKDKMRAALKELKEEYDHNKTAVGQMKDRLEVIPEELSSARKEKSKAKKELADLESGRTKEKELKGAADEWKAQDKKFDQEEKQLEKSAKKRTDDFKKGLG